MVEVAFVNQSSHRIPVGWVTECVNVENGDLVVAHYKEASGCMSKAISGCSAMVTGMSSDGAKVNVHFQNSVVQGIPTQYITQVTKLRVGDRVRTFVESG